MSINLAEQHADIILGFVHEERQVIEAIDPRIGTISLNQVSVDRLDPSTYKASPILLESCETNSYFNDYNVAANLRALSKTALCVQSPERLKLNMIGQYQGDS